MFTLVCVFGLGICTCLCCRANLPDVYPVIVKMMSIFFAVMHKGMSVFNKHPSNRSGFYLRLNENQDNSLNLYDSSKFTFILDYFFPDIKNYSYNGWRPCRNQKDLDTIWLRSGLPGDVLDSIKRWAQFAIRQSVWINPSKDILSNFSGNELDFCLAADFNCAINEVGNVDFSCLTDIGKAEQQLKYCLSAISMEDRQHYCDIMDSAMQDIFNLLPLPNTNEQASLSTTMRTVISPVPAVVSSQNKIAWILATHMAKKNALNCLQPMLVCSKPEMKTLSVSQKINTWKELFSKNQLANIQSKDIAGNTVIIVDDLYQSGASVWAYAQYLKKIGARTVYGLVCVKSMRDTDNR